MEARLEGCRIDVFDVEDVVLLVEELDVRVVVDHCEKDVAMVISDDLVGVFLFFKCHFDVGCVVVVFGCG